MTGALYLLVWTAYLVGCVIMFAACENTRARNIPPNLQPVARDVLQTLMVVLWPPFMVLYLIGKVKRL